MKTQITNKNIDADYILKFLRENRGYLEKKFGVTKMALFGSYARRQATSSSDIDLLIEMKVADYFQRFYLQEFLEQELGHKVDVGYFDSVRKLIKEQIERDLIYV